MAIQKRYSRKAGKIRLPLNVANDFPPHRINVIDGRLPEGLINSNGLIEGETKEVGTFPLIVLVEDSANNRTEIKVTLEIK
jgi:hypothetical protein